MSNLSHYLNTSDARFNNVKAFIGKKKKEIPIFALCQLSHVKSKTLDGLLRIHLINEMNTLLFDTSNRYTVKTRGNYWEKDFDNAYLDKLSTYRMLTEWMQYPIGLAAEAWVEKQNFACPMCGEKALVLSGGSSTAWADLHCYLCKDVFIEVKTKWTNALRKIKSKKWMTAGSHRWFKAQQSIGIKHYMLIVPKNGGEVQFTKIKSADATVDNKFCAYYKHDPEKATLRSYLKLNKLLPIGECSYHEMKVLTKSAADIVAQWLKIVFGRYAKKIQRIYRKKCLLTELEQKV